MCCRIHEPNKMASIIDVEKTIQLSVQNHRLAVLHSGVTVYLMHIHFHSFQYENRLTGQMFGSGRGSQICDLSKTNKMSYHKE